MRTTLGALALILVLAACGTLDPQVLPDANLSYVDLTAADLTFADLTGTPPPDLERD